MPDAGCWVLDARCRRRSQRSLSAAPSSRLLLSPSLKANSAAWRSWARRVRRMPIARESGGALSRITSAKAPLRNNTSAHHAAFSGVWGRMTQKRPLLPNAAQSLGASVRCASIYATQRLARSACEATARASVVLPPPNGPCSSVSRPRGMPPARQSPVQHARACRDPLGASSGFGELLPRRQDRNCLVSKALA